VCVCVCVYIYIYTYMHIWVTGQGLTLPPPDCAIVVRVSAWSELNGTPRSRVNPNLPHVTPGGSTGCA